MSRKGLKMTGGKVKVSESEYPRNTVKMGLKKEDEKQYRWRRKDMAGTSND